MDKILFHKNMKYVFAILLITNVGAAIVEHNLSSFFGWLMVCMWFFVPKHVTWKNWEEFHNDSM